jgi:dihydroxy-acid dehydratase
MSRDLRSRHQFQGITRSLQRAWIKGAGLTDADLDRPLVAVVNTYQDFSPENAHLRRVADAVKAGIYRAGGTPCEFNAFHVTDSETFASEGMRYVLPSRDVVADLIELMVQGHRFDAMVLLPSGDKVVPGMVMAAARLDLPSVLLYGGPTPVGRWRGRKVFLETVYDGVGEVLRGSLSRADLAGMEDAHFPGPGACDTATSGNTAGLYTEALGLALPGTGTLAAGSNAQLRAAQATGIEIMRLVAEDVRPSRLLTAAAFENAMRVGMAQDQPDARGGKAADAGGEHGLHHASSRWGSPAASARARRRDWRARATSISTVAPTTSTTTPRSNRSALASGILPRPGISA